MQGVCPRLRLCLMPGLRDVRGSCRDLVWLMWPAWRCCPKSPRSELPPPLLLGTPPSPETQSVPSAIYLKAIHIKHDICVNYKECLQAPLSAAARETVSAENVRWLKDGIISFFFFSPVPQLSWGKEAGYLAHLGVAKQCQGSPWMRCKPKKPLALSLRVNLAVVHAPKSDKLGNFAEGLSRKIEQLCVRCRVIICWGSVLFGFYSLCFH